MNTLDDLSLLQILEKVRPSDYVSLGLSGKVHNALINDPLIRYTLLKYWCPTDKTAEELIEYVPNITLRQISILADYYYPTPQSIGKYPITELFYNACKAGYSVEDCLVYYNKQADILVSLLASVLVTNRQDILDYWRVNGKLKEFFGGAAINEYMSILRHRDMTLKLWVDTIIKYGASDKFLDTIFNSSAMGARTISRLFRSGNAEIDRLASHFGRTYASINPNARVLADNSNNIIMKHKLGIPQTANSGKVAQILSRYDSVIFPSYDLFDDICAGNYLEVMHKVNTYNRDILATDLSDREPNDMTKYIAYTSNDVITLPPLVEVYNVARLETVGQASLHMKGKELRRYLDTRELQLEQ